MMEWSYLLFFVLLASNSVTAIIPSNPKITDAPTNLHLQKREPWPDNVLLMVPEHVDERFFSIDGNGNTQGIVDHFSTVTVTESRRGVESVSRTHTARVGIHTTGVGKDGTQYAFEVAPAIREIIKNAYHSVAKRDLDSSADITIRQLSNIRVPDPALVRPAVAVANALNAEAGPSLIGVATEGATLAEVASAGALPAVEGASTVLLGATVVPYVALIAWVSFAWVGILQALSKTPQLDLPHAVVIDLSRLPNSDQCSGSPPSCDAETCKGLNSICTVGPACPCENKPAQCNDNEEISDCAKCTGQNGKCTTGDKAGCSCIDIIEDFPYDVMEDGEIFYSYMFDYWDQWFTQADAGRGNPSANPTCAPDADLAQLSPPPLLSVGERQRSPRDVLYDIRHVMCTNKCEAPDGYPPKSAKFEKKGANGCELSVLLSSNIEAYAVRESELVGPGPQVDDCWASFDNITHKCIDPIGPNKRGLVEGPDQGERFEMGYRKKNGGNKLHSDFQDGDELSQYCGAEPPKCDTCYGGANNNVCSQGDYSGCPCTPVTTTQPAPPKATNCATAVAAALIVCCGWSQDTQKTCANQMEGCGVIARLDITCQSPIPVDGSSVYQSPCGQFQPGDPIVRGSAMEDKAQCLVSTFNLQADLQFA